MNGVATLALLVWIPLAVAVFAVLPGRRAVLVTMITGWLFLPMTEISMPGLPNFGKTGAVAIGSLLGVFLFDFGRLAAYRVRALDLAVVGLCVAPMASSLANGLGAYDGASAMMGPMEMWAIPYLLGRLYFADAVGMRELAIAVFIGGLVYIPLCMIEFVMSPQLHRWVYGDHAHEFQQTRRYGGYRPTVFMQHGLGVGMWMTAASLCGVWLVWTGALKRVLSVPAAWLVPVLLVTTVFCKSFGALMLLAWGIAALASTKWLRTTLAVWVLVLMSLAYIGLRTPGLWMGDNIVELAGSIGGEQRAGSLNFRLRNEDILIGRALEQPVFGWGGWGRNRPDGETAETVVTDGLWVIALGKTGAVGLVLLLAAMLGPTAMFLWRYPSSVWYHPSLSAGAAMATLLALYMIDCLFNAIPNPVFVLAAGGLVGLAGSRPEAASRVSGSVLSQGWQASGRQRGYQSYRS